MKDDTKKTVRLSKEKLEEIRQYKHLMVELEFESEILEKKAKLLHFKLWESIYEEYPQAREGNWSIDHTTGELSPAEEDGMPRKLKAMLDQVARRIKEEEGIDMVPIALNDSDSDKVLN